MGQSPSSAVTLLPEINRREGHDTVADNLTADDLPDDCLAGIFNFLSPADRNRCSLVCRRWLRVDGQSRRCLSLNGQAELLDLVPSLFSRFDCVTRLILRCDRKSTNIINDEALILISLRCVNLRRLKLRGCRKITYTGMSAIGDNCKSLKKLSCASCMFGVKGINAVIDRCNTLEELSVKKLCGVHDSNMVVGLSSAATTSLKSIFLKGLVNGQSFAPLIIGSKKLRSLRVISCLGDWDDTLKSVGRFNNGLVELHLEKIHVSDVGLLGVSKCLSLDTLHIVKTAECSNDGLSGVAERCRKLRKLHIDGWGNKRIGDDGLLSVATHCLNLQDLVLIGISPTSLSLGEIASNCKGLERLALCRIDTLGDAEIRCIAKKCVALKKLCIKWCPISNVGIGALASGCPNLVKVKVRRCRKVTGKAVEWVREHRVSLEFSFDDTEVKALDGSGGGGAQDGAMAAFPPALNQEAEADVASSSNNNALTMLRTTFEFNCMLQILLLSHELLVIVLILLTTLANYPHWSFLFWLFVLMVIIVAL